MELFIQKLNIDTIIVSGQIIENLLFLKFLDNDGLFILVYWYICKYTLKNSPQ